MEAETKKPYHIAQHSKTPVEGTLKASTSHDRLAYTNIREVNINYPEVPPRSNKDFAFTISTNPDAGNPETLSRVCITPCVGTHQAPTTLQEAIPVRMKRWHMETGPLCLPRSKAKTNGESQNPTNKTQHISTLHVPFHDPSITPHYIIYRQLLPPQYIMYP